MKNLTLAVLSDLHVGRTRAKDLSPTDPSKAVDPEYRDRFLKFLTQEKIVADYLILPGDVSDRAQPDEFELASDLVNSVAKRLKVPKDRILFVPGNHDADWSAVTNYPNDKSGYRRAQMYAPLRHARWIFEKIMARAHAHVLEDPHFAIWDLNDLFCVGYNSSAYDDPDQAVHHGLLSLDSLSKLREELKKHDLSGRRLKLFLVHHHPLPYSDPIFNEPDFSIMSNALELQKFLHEHDFDLVIHGHKHKPNFLTLSINVASPIPVLAAGSFSAQLDTRWSGVVTNQFHIVKVLGRDADQEAVYGQVVSWAYTSVHGWTPSAPNHGIRHIEPFGTYTHPAVLKDRLAQILVAEFAASNYIELSTLRTRDANFKFIPTELLLSVLAKLTDPLGFRVHGKATEDIVLLKDDSAHA